MNLQPSMRKNPQLFKKIGTDLCIFKLLVFVIVIASLDRFWHFNIFILYIKSV